MKYNCHTNAYCLMAKNLSLEKCLANQLLIQKSYSGDTGVCNVCYAGVCQIIYPFHLRGETAGFVAVSGYRKSEECVENILNHSLWKDMLSKDIPVELCNTVIPPLCIMLERLVLVKSEENDSEYNLILQFLTEYYASISLDELSNHFNRSKSHISHLFKKNCGISISAYCNNLKLEASKNLLLKTHLSITEIAFNVGFNDTSYFIHLFKNKFGITPLQYKQNPLKIT